MTTHQLKPIETSFDGYRFRSRLEARWAVFLKALGIPYEYEKEGFDLAEAGRYLPDFWLPNLDMFLEIKGKSLDVQTRQKPAALAAQGRYNVVVMDDGIDSDRVMADDPRYYTQPCGAIFIGDHQTIDKESRLGLKVGLPYYDSSDLLSFLKDKYTEGLIDGLEPTYDGSEDSWRQLIRQDEQYFQRRYGRPHHAYVQGVSWHRGISWRRLPSGRYILDWNEPGYYTDRHLLAAYTAARSARFEHGEHGGRR